jgi:hypothetical protein
VPSTITPSLQIMKKEMTTESVRDNGRYIVWRHAPSATCQLRPW